MGSAFGALGADLTSQSINPAGLASYRATEIGLGFGVSVTNNTSDYYGATVEEDKVRVPFNILGVAFNIGNTLRETNTGLINHNISISYSRLASYDKTSVYENLYRYNSMLDYFCDRSCHNDAFTQNLALRSEDQNGYRDAAWWLYSEIEDENGSIHDLTYTNVWEDAWWDTKNNDVMLDPAARYSINANGNKEGDIEISQIVNEKGNKGETSFSYAFNLSNVVYIGTSIGLQSYSYKRNITHQEYYHGTPADPDVANSYEYGNELKQDGTGVNFKLGTIIVPVTPVRIGLAIHSPTFYSIDERYESWLQDAYDDDFWNSPIGESHYNYRVPSKFIGSIAGVIGNFGIVSVDYERTNNSKGKFSSTDENDRTLRDATENVKSSLKATNSLRIGVEGRVLESLYLRAGYNLQTTPYQDWVLIKSYKNQAFSGGLGYRNTNFFVDLAYTCRKTNNEHWVLPDADVYSYEQNMPSFDETMSHKVTMTLGLRF